jgi:hypothetical protein
MWQAIKHRKVERVLGLQHADAPAAWRAIVDNSEDLLTSGVLERLGYLPGATAMEIVLRAAEVKELRWLPLPEAIEASIPWPRVEDDDGWREPDWVWLTASYVVVFEAKWGRGHVPTPDQLAGQRALCQERWPGRRLLHVALVQSGNVSFPDGSSALVVLWSALRTSASSELAKDRPDHERRILLDMRDMLDARGVALRFLDSLPAISVQGAMAPLVAPVVVPTDRLGALPPLPISEAISFAW